MYDNQEIIKALCQDIITQVNADNIREIAFVKIDFTQRPLIYGTEALTTRRLVDLIESTESKAVEKKDFEMLASFNKLHNKALRDPYSKQIFLSYNHRFSNGVKIFHTVSFNNLFEIINNSISLEIEIQEILESAVAVKAKSN